MIRADRRRYSGLVDDILKTSKDVLGVADGMVSDPEGIVESIEIQTAYFPPLRLDRPLESGTDGGKPDPIMQALKPKVVIKLKGMKAYNFVPFGEPGPTKWPWIRAGAVVGGLGLAWLVFRGITK